MSRIIEINWKRLWNYHQEDKMVSLASNLQKNGPDALDLDKLKFYFEDDKPSAKPFPDITGSDFLHYLRRSGLLCQCLGLHEGDAINYYAERLVPHWWPKKKIHLWKSASLSLTEDGVWVPYLKLGHANDGTDFDGRKSEICWERLDDGRWSYGLEDRPVYPNLLLMPADLLVDRFKLW